jgi:hypothetical protein
MRSFCLVFLFYRLYNPLRQSSWIRYPIPSSMLPIRSRWTVHGLSKRLLFYSVTAEMVIFSAMCVQLLCIGFYNPETPKSGLVSIPFPCSYFSITHLPSVSLVLWTIFPLCFIAHGLFSEEESQFYSHHSFGMAAMAHSVTVMVFFIPL